MVSVNRGNNILPKYPARYACLDSGFVMLDRQLKRFHALKADLLTVLDRPDVPLHTNGSENDIRSHVTRRKVSGGTRSGAGRDCRDASSA